MYILYYMYVYTQLARATQGGLYFIDFLFAKPTPIHK